MRGVWIEIQPTAPIKSTIVGRTSWEVCGLKFSKKSQRAVSLRRTSWEVCGLKLHTHSGNAFRIVSHLVRGVWIEICWKEENELVMSVAPRERCVDWNSLVWGTQFNAYASHLVRGVWIEILQSPTYSAADKLSHLVRGVWIEMQTVSVAFISTLGRTSWEVCGLKYYYIFITHLFYMSHLVRGVWIEIIIVGVVNFMFSSRTSWEVCGLKFNCSNFVILLIPSHLVRGVWIEIKRWRIKRVVLPLSHLVRGVWIEMTS